MFFNSKDTQNSETEEAGLMQAMAEIRPDTVRFKSRVYIEMDMVKVFENKLFFRRISRILLPELFSAELNKNVHVFQRIIRINIQNIFKYRKRKKTIYSQTHGICWGLNYIIF